MSKASEGGGVMKKEEEQNFSNSLFIKKGKTKITEKIKRIFFIALEVNLESVPVPLEKSNFYKMKEEQYLDLNLSAGLCDHSSELQGRGMLPRFGVWSCSWLRRASCLKPD